MTAQRTTASCDFANHNPLAIRLNPANKWLGRISPNRNTDGAFEQFFDPVSGLRAGVGLILAHANRRGANTIAKLIRLWDPATENNTVAYIARVARLTGFGAHQVLDFRRSEHLRPVLIAMIRVESGTQPYSDATIDEALAKAGVTSSTWRTTIA